MGTTLRPELSKTNPYWIDKHRYYELKHFCLQYFTWKAFVNSVDGLSRRPDLCIFVSDVNDPTAQAAITREHYREKMQLVQKCAFEADPVIGEYIFKAKQANASGVSIFEQGILLKLCQPKWKCELECTLGTCSLVIFV